MNTYCLLLLMVVYVYGRYALMQSVYQSEPRAYAWTRGIEKQMDEHMCTNHDETMGILITLREQISYHYRSCLVYPDDSACANPPALITRSAVDAMMQLYVKTHDAPCNVEQKKQLGIMLEAVCHWRNYIDITFNESYIRDPPL
jgi:hypothetical protein